MYKIYNIKDKIIFNFVPLEGYKCMAVNTKGYCQIAIPSSTIDCYKL